MSLIFTKTQCRCWKYIYFWQSFLALKKRKMMEIWKNKNTKNLKILLFTLPDVDDLIKHTFAYWHTWARPPPQRPSHPPYFWQSFLALKKQNMIEIWKNQNAKSFKILLFTLPDVKDLIKHTFAYWHTRTIQAKLRYWRINAQ